MRRRRIRLADLQWALVFRRIRRIFPDVRHLSVESLAARLASASTESKPVILDTRELDEYEVSHLRDAIHVGPDVIRSEIHKSLEPSRTIVTYCSIGYRSAVVARQLTELGFEHVYNLEGSIFRWAAEGYEIIREGRPTGEVHPCTRRWGLLLPRRLRARI